MENHDLGIGMLKTDCEVVAYPEAASAMRSTMDRALSGRFAGMLAKAAEPVLDGHEGVVRIRTIKLDLAHSGPWDENSLAAMLAERLSLALHKALRSRSPDCWSWTDHLAYMAAYVDMRLGFTHAPGWAFPDFKALGLLSPVQAALEIVKARPAVLMVLARNGQRTGSRRRFAERLDAAAAKQLVLRLLEPDADATIAFDVATPLQIADAAFEIVRRSAEPNPDKQLLHVICEVVATAGPEDIAILAFSSALAVALARVGAAIEQRHGRPMSAAELDLVRELAGEALPAHHAVFLLCVLDRRSADPVVARLVERIAGTAAHGSARKREGQREPVASKSAPLHLSSAFAGLSLLLPDVMRLSLHRQLGLNGLREAVLSIPDMASRESIEVDALASFLFPAMPETDHPDFPPVPEAAISRLAPESRGLMQGRPGAAGWGDLLLASFASRLPGLRASSRAYLQRQFLLVPGHAEITDAAVIVTLDGPPLSIILKMAGLSGDQMPLPHLDGRFLVLNVGGTR